MSRHDLWLLVALSIVGPSCSDSSSSPSGSAGSSGSRGTAGASVAGASGKDAAGSDAGSANGGKGAAGAGSGAAHGGASGGAGMSAAIGGSGGANAGGAAAVGGGSAGSNAQAGGAAGSTGSSAGFPAAWPWVSWYGPSGGASVISQVAAMFRVINIDADPDADNLSDAEIASLRANGQNRVLSYLNLGSCENFRSYYSTAPAGHKSCQSSGALTSTYDGYPDEMWANLGNADYQDLMVNYVAPRLIARGVDGFYLDNLEVVEHGTKTSNGPCDATCSQGGLDLIWQLRQRFPDKLIVMQNASSDTTRLGSSHGVAFPSLLDGVSHEEVYSNGGDSQALAEMKKWRDMNLTVHGQPFWLAVEEYVGACSSAKKSAADAIYAMAKADGFNAYVTDDSGMQAAPCFW